MSGQLCDNSISELRHEDCTVSEISASDVTETPSVNVADSANTHSRQSTIDSSTVSNSTIDEADSSKLSARHSSGSSAKPKSHRRRHKNEDSADFVDSLMDRIDQELLVLTSLDEPLPVPDIKSRLKESTMARLAEPLPQMTIDSKVNGTTIGSQPHQSPKVSPGDSVADTGLGSTSVGEVESKPSPVALKHPPQMSNGHVVDSDSEVEIRRVGNGRLSPEPSDLDSEIAAEVEHKYQQIMKQKRGGYLKTLQPNPTSEPKHFEDESVQTEEFENRFKEAAAVDRDSILGSTDVISPTTGSSRPDKKSQSRRVKMSSSGNSDAASIKTEDYNKQYIDRMVFFPFDHNAKTYGLLEKNSSDIDSVRTEDYYKQFAKLRMKTMKKATTNSAKKPSPLVTSGSASRQRSTFPMKASVHFDHSSRRQDSDLDSVNTEDFERHFADSMVPTYQGVSSHRRTGSTNYTSYNAPKSSLRPSALSASVLPSATPSYWQTDPLSQLRDSQYQPSYERPSYVSPSRVRPRDRKHVLSTHPTDQDSPYLSANIVDTLAEQHITQQRPSSRASNTSTVKSSKRSSSAGTYTKKNTGHPVSSSHSSPESDKQPITAHNRSESESDASLIATGPERYMMDGSASAADDIQLPRRSGSDLDLSAEHLEIQRQSQKIKQEMEMERRYKLTQSTPNLATVGRTEDELVNQRFSQQLAEQARMAESLEGELMRKTDELRELNLSIQQSQEQRNRTMDDLQTLQDSMCAARNQLEQLCEQEREHSKLAEEARTQCMVDEYKRENVRKELSQLTEDVGSKKKELNDLQGSLLKQREILEDMSQLGITNPEQIRALYQEKDLLLEKISQLEGQLSAMEQQRQVNEKMKTEFSDEQKHLSETTRRLEEELRNAQDQCRDLSADRNRLAEALISEQDKFAQLEEEHIQLSQERNMEAEDHKHEVSEVIRSLKDKTNVEVEHMQKQLDAANTSLSEAEEQLKSKDDICKQLRDQLSTARSERDQEIERSKKMKDEHSSQMNNSLVDKEEALSQLRTKLMRERDVEMNRISEQLDKAHRSALAESTDRLSRQVAELKSNLTENESELRRVKHDLRSKEDEISDVRRKLNEEMDRKIRETIDKERRMHEIDKQKFADMQLMHCRSEHSRAINKVQSDLSREQQAVQDLKKDIDSLKEDAAEQRRQNIGLQKEKIIMVNRVKDELRQEREKELDKLRNKLKEEHSKEVSKFRDLMKEKDDEIHQLKSKTVTQTHVNRENQTQHERMERMVIQELNDECRKISAILGVTPRKLTPVRTSSSGSSPKSSTGLASSTPTGSPSSNRAVLTTAMASLRACCEELRSHALELKRDVETNKFNLTQLQTEKEKDRITLEDLKRKLRKEKARSFDPIRDKLQIERNLSGIPVLSNDDDSELLALRRNMNSWRRDTEDRKFREQRLSEHEAEKAAGLTRPIRSFSSTGPSTSPGQTSETTVSETSPTSAVSGSRSTPPRESSLVPHLYELVRELRTENKQLKAQQLRAVAGTSSDPDCSPVSGLLLASVPSKSTPNLLSNCPADHQLHVLGASRSAFSPKLLTDQALISSAARSSSIPQQLQRKKVGDIDQLQRHLKDASGKYSTSSLPSGRTKP